MLHRNENKTLQEIEFKYYMRPMITKINADISVKTLSLQEVFNHLYGYLVDCRDEVENLIKKRIQKVRLKTLHKPEKVSLEVPLQISLFGYFLKIKSKAV